MDWKRTARHLWTGKPEVETLFPPASLERITAAIAASEAGHHGEIRFAVEGSLDLMPLFSGVTARERAVQVFSQLRVWDTEENNGILIYLLVADRDVEILADRGVHAKVGPAGWEEICKAMEAEFRQGRFEAGVIQGIQAVGKHLSTHFPLTGAQDVNELPDSPVIL
ncbi:MAG: hypothetical protein JWP91_2674 [Fibrobacteres bacterium]|nr:hypothetical protein [Fibrobacterota bacterium]